MTGPSKCKFYDPDTPINKAEIDSFLSLSGKWFATSDGERGFSERLIVSTTDKWGKNAELSLSNQAVPLRVSGSRIWLPAHIRQRASTVLLPSLLRRRLLSLGAKLANEWRQVDCRAMAILRAAS
ncbi:restriction endonuclease [Paraburkholderia domus]|uniref:restriction endonuclease n=1 Tax=Paraburkholderia domus TaxID=2793075 RepID=UPI0038B29F51